MLAVYGLAWLADSRNLVAAVVPPGRGEAPAAPGTPAGPVVQEVLEAYFSPAVHSGRKAAELAAAPEAHP